MASNRFFRSRDRVLGGVLSGFAEHINSDKMLVRLISVLISLFSAGFPGLLEGISILFSGLLRRKNPWGLNKNIEVCYFDKNKEPFALF